MPARSRAARCRRFEEATGLDLSDRDGRLREDLPPITTFLNRLLALPIASAERAVRRVRGTAASRIEGAIAAGTYDVGVETLTAESLLVTERRTVYTHPPSGAETRCSPSCAGTATGRFTLADALALAGDPRARLLVNAQSGRAAVQVPAPSLMLDDGEVERRVRLLRPMEREAIASTRWRTRIGRRRTRDFARAWEAEIAAVPEFTESASTSSPACCCRSGTGCPTNPCASIASRPTTASASSAAWSRRPGRAGGR